MISADGLTVILISSDDFLFFFLFRQSSSSKWIVDPFQMIRNSRNLLVGNGDLLFFPATRASKCSIKRARSAVARKQNQIVHPWSRRGARDGARDQLSEYSLPPKEYSGRKYLFRRSRSSIDGPDSRGAFGAKVLHGAPSVVLWKVFQPSRSFSLLSLRPGRNPQAIRRRRLQKNIVRPTDQSQVPRQRPVSFRLRVSRYFLGRNDEPERSREIIRCAQRKDTQRNAAIDKAESNLSNRPVTAGGKHQVSRLLERFFEAGFFRGLVSGVMARLRAPPSIAPYHVWRRQLWDCVLT